VRGILTINDVLGRLLYSRDGGRRTGGAEALGSVDRLSRAGCLRATAGFLFAIVPAFAGAA
jgi:hypothetical protein